MGTRIRVVAAIVALLLLTSACMRAKLEREYRRPWSRYTTVAEDAAWTVETGLLETGRVVGLMALNVVTFGAVGWLLEDDEDEAPTYAEDWGPRQAPASPAPRAPSGRTVATGTRRDRPREPPPPPRRRTRPEGERPR